MKHLLLTAVSMIFFFSAYGQDWKYLEKTAFEQKELSKADVVVLLDSIGVDVNESGSGSFVIRKVFKVQSDRGALKNRVIKYDYDPLTAFAEFKSVKVYKADGTVRELDIKTALDYAAPARAIYWGARQIMIEPGFLVPGDIVDYQINKKGFTYALLGDAGEDEDRFIPPMRGQFYDIVPFWCAEPTMKKVYCALFPKSMNMQYQFYQGECESAVRFQGNKTLYRFAMENVRPFASESNMVDLYDVAPKLMMSSTPSWYEKSKWFYKVNEDYGSFEADPDAQKKVNELIKGAKTQMEKISVLTHWVADNMRYSGISMGEGEGFTLHNTKMNFTDRCGVCKDKAALLISMLRMAGMEAYPAMTMAGSRVETIPADHFNHSVVVVKLDPETKIPVSPSGLPTMPVIHLASGSYMPLDPTWVPFNRELWSSAEQQQNYLPGLPEGADLQTTSLSPVENHYFKLNAVSSIDAKGTLKGVLTIEGEGQTDANIRRPFTSGLASEWKNSMERELIKVAPQARLISVDYGKDPNNYALGPIKIVMKFEIPNYAVVGKGTLLFKPVVFTPVYSGVKTFKNINLSLENRKYGFKDACSRLVQYNETITLPKGYQAIFKDMAKQSKSDAADFDGYYKQENGKIVVKVDLALKKRVYDSSDWNGFREALNHYNSFDNNEIIAVFK